jgi:ABC-type amino acid transport substrate-binding protein
MFRALVWTMILLVALCGPAQAGDAQSAYERVISSGTIRCGYWTWPPYLLKDANTGALSGPTYDYMEAIGRELDLKIEWTEEVAAGTFTAGLNANRYDVMCMSIWPDAGRMKTLTMTTPIFYSAVFAVTRKDDHRFEGDLEKINAAGVRLTGIEGDVSYTVGPSDFPKAQASAMPQMTDIGLLLQNVADGKADVTFVDAGVVADFNKTNGDVLALVKDVPPVKIFPEVLGVKNGELHLKAMLDSAINVLDNNRFAAKILRGYQMSSYPAFADYDLAFKEH